MAEKTATALAEQADRQKLTFGDRPICNVLRPFFLDSRAYERIRHGAGLVMRASAKLYRALMQNATLRAQMDLSEEEEAVIQIEPGYEAPDASARLDGFLDDASQVQFVEYNAESPGGLIFGDVLSEVFLDLTVMREFVRRFPVRSIPLRTRILDTLLDNYRQWGGSRSPRIAIVDWGDVRTRQEFVLFQEFLASRGIASIIADPADLEYHGRELQVGDFTIDLVYKRVVTGELLARCGLDHPLIRATRDRVVCTVNSFRVQMLFKKMLFGLLSDPDQASLFDEEERTAITRHLPWTRKMKADWTTNRDGHRIDLIDFVRREKDRLVLKPNSEYGGRGVVLGWSCDQTDWEDALEEALKSSFVVQERVAVGMERYPSYASGQLRYDDRYFDIDPYVWQGNRVEGCGIRLSSSALLNVSAGGGSAIPVFLLSPG
ncbi:MAG: hypothetical protein HY650_13860 [Acidobacteria bacterium]|nr:hypothetical protein [Acidobacteriota bacterium]